MHATVNFAVYNSRIRAMFFPPLRAARIGWVLLLPLLFASNTFAADWRIPVGQLAEKIAAVTGPGAVALTVESRGTISAPETASIRKLLLQQLASLGIHSREADQASATVQVSLSEDLQDYIWVAQIQQGTTQPAVVMVAMPRPDGSVASRDSGALTLRRSPLWSQETRILDVATVGGNPQHMIVLDGANVTLYKLQDNRWQQEQALAIPHLRPWPRDLRGRLLLRQDHLFDAYLPGVVCRSTNSAPLTMNCAESDDPWPLGNGQDNLNAFYAPNRNFFPGALAPGVGKKSTAPAFYSAAPLPREKYTLWLFTSIDGQLHLLDGVTDQVAGTPNWGSDIATVHSGCGSSWQLVASSRNEHGDSVRAFEMPDREPVAVSPPVDFGGSITALWTDSDGTSATAIAQNSETGRYEAYRLNISCGQ